ncbi:restriction endonuclease subunit S [Nitrosomonas sp. Nm34]|uniref:restriction endonuclease subunit S n=1 Tax=Nitrosomonas sp. Nm34 TaxID=1881055 RepID=UPI0008E4CEE5|nr:restriction endonuclease subunit S [Nitrosomonas sp. Nm34]SFI83333.1 type I restriction enzyme, S subunit [Nitrosomonas sp. Nm34]
MQRYESYKPTTIEWASKIPADWRVQPIRALFKERKEKNKGPKTDFILSVMKDIGIIPYDEKGNIGNKKSENIENYKVVYPGDLVVNKMNAIIGSLGISRFHGALSQVYFVLYPKDLSRTNHKYLGYLFKVRPFQQSLIKISKGMMELRESIEFDEFKKLVLPVPPRDEQDRIVAFLDQKTAEIDAAIMKKERLIELLNEQRSIQTNRAVTLGLDRAAPLRNGESEWIESVPEHWEIVPLKHISTVQSGVTLGKNFVLSKSTKSYPYLRVANVQDGYINLSTVTEIILPIREAKNYLLRAGNILVTEGGDIDKLGRGNCWDGQIEECLHQNHVFAVRILKRVRPEFVALITGVSYARRYFTTTANKTTNLASTNKTKLGNLPVLVPPLSEQDAILDFCNKSKTKYAKIIDSVAKEISALKDMKSSLIAEAVAGRIRV